MISPSPPPAARSATRSAPLAALFASLRPRQWTKNALLFAGLLFTIDEGHSGGDFVRVALGFAFFCALSGCVYLFNDLVDLEADRKHPRKRHRPLAAGQLSPGLARGTALTLLPTTLFLSGWCLGPLFAGTAGLYFTAALLYSIHLKHVVLLDVMTLAAGFVLRAVAGAVAIRVPISEWLLLCTALLALFLGLAKRRGELAALGDSPATRRILADYSIPLLDQMITIVASACVMAYSLYTFYSKTGAGRPYLMATIPFVIYGLFRYLYLSHRKGMGEAPETVLLEDRPLLINILLWVLTAALVMLSGHH